MARIFEKDPNEVLEVTVDWENLMNEVGSPSDSITGSVWELPTASPAELVSVSEAVTVDTATILLSGGDPGNVYRLRNRITTFLGSTFERFVYIQVADMEPGTLSSSLIVEDGTQVANSNSYTTREYVSAYHAARGNDTWFDLTPQEMDSHIIKAADYLTQMFTERWKGIRISLTQSMDWPRAGVFTEDYRDPNTEPSQIIRDDLSFLFPEDEVPEEVRQAQAILALESVSGSLNPSQSRGGDIKRVKAGSAEVEWFESASSAARNFPAVWGSGSGLLAKYLQPRRSRLQRG